MSDSIPIVHLRKNSERRLDIGHLWVFSNEVADVTGNPSAGDPVEVRSQTGRFLGLADYNPHSLIACRIITRSHTPPDVPFLTRKTHAAWELRKRLFPGEDSYRLIFGESDLLPGLVVDKYADVLVLQTLTAGMEKRKEEIVQALETVLHPSAIFERNDSPLRALEGFPQTSGVLRGALPETLTITQSGLKFEIDVAEGQKTGFFLDQRENRLALAPYVQGARVLDCFSYTGAFSLFAASLGAASVRGIDISEKAIEGARRNAELNGFAERCRFETGDVFKTLRESRDQYDLIILDPPSFTRNKSQLPDARRGYQNLNAMAMRMLSPSGILVTCSCSHHLEEEDFRGVLARAGREARRTLRLLEFRSQSRDHPVLLAMRETRYLKCAIIEVL